MNNSDMPAMPFIEKPEYQWNYSGLTKREHIAIAAMQGMLANPAMIDIHNKESIEWIAKHARGQADALLKELANNETT